MAVWLMLPSCGGKQVAPAAPIDVDVPFAVLIAQYIGPEMGSYSNCSGKHELDWQIVSV
jgi:hypothetical protein